jgi:hypothetical protein
MHAGATDKPGRDNFLFIYNSTFIFIIYLFISIAQKPLSSHPMNTTYCSCNNRTRVSEIESIWFNKEPGM